MAVNLAVAILVVGGGAALVWTGLADPSDGLVGEIGKVLRGEPTEAASKGGLGMLGRQASAATAASIGSVGGMIGGTVPDQGGGGAVGGVVVPPGLTGGRTGVLSVAQAQLGKPYVWGAKGPGSYDCSGLVQYAYQHGAGLSVPAPAASQALRGVAVSEAQAQPGDLVCYGHPAWHIGIYLGNKRLLHAANPSKGVCTESVTWNGDRYYRSLLGAVNA